ncbi:MAG: hypothetical protein JRJ39_14860 [Deltaproteobacteria bacterium]|nr:hypothetical protein [Deltaproteobacteria bacterium]
MEPWWKKTLIHDAIIRDHSLIGMKSMICDGATVNEWVILAEQSLVRKNQTLSSGKIYAGSPAREIRGLSEAYMDLIAQYHDTFKRID